MVVRYDALQSATTAVHDFAETIVITLLKVPTKCQGFRPNYIYVCKRMFVHYNTHCEVIHNLVNAI